MRGAPSTKLIFMLALLLLHATRAARPLPDGGTATGRERVRAAGPHARLRGERACGERDHAATLASASRAGAECGAASGASPAVADSAAAPSKRPELRVVKERREIGSDMEAS